MPADPADVERLRQLVAECLERIERDGESGLGAFCREHSEDADVIRRRIALLRGAGVVATEAGADGGDAVRPSVPARLGPFHLRETLGSGGMGVVYRAEQEPMGRTVALKLLRPEHLYFPGARVRFAREVETLARLQDPGIVQVFAGGEEQGLPYLAMELVPGLSLATLMVELRGIGSPRLDGKHALRALRQHGETTAATQLLCAGSWVEFCCRVVVQAARALSHAHERGVLHRDIKPQNLMLTPAGRVVLLDFGLASFDGASRLTRTGAHLGSLPYMAPEQVRSGAGAADERTDVYALGVTLYELLTLREAFATESSEDTRRRILAGDCPRVTTLNPGVPRDAQTVCQTAMQLDPAHRYASAAEFARDLGRFLAIEPIAAQPPGVWRRLRLRVRRHRAASLAAVLGFLLLVVAPGAFALQRSWALDLARGEERKRTESTKLALAAVDEMLTRVADRWLAQEPRSERVRRDLLAAARSMYARFLREQGEDPAVLFEVASVGERIGGIELTLNEVAAAEDSLRQALAILDRLAPPEPLLTRVRRARATCRVQLAKVLVSTVHPGQAGPLLDDAVAALAAEHTAFPDDDALHLILLKALADRALLLMRSNDDNGARTQLQQIVPQVEALTQRRPDDVDVGRLRADTHRLLALSGGPDSAAREREFRTVLLIFEDLAHKAPAEDFRQDLARALDQVVSSLASRGDAAEREALQRRAIDLHDRLVAEFPGRAVLLRGRAESLARWAEFLVTADRLDEADAAFARSIADRRTLLDHSPQVRDHRALLALTQLRLALLQKRRGDLDQARVTAESAQAHVRILQAAAPDNPNHHAESAWVSHALAQVLAAQRQDADALLAWQDAVGAQAHALRLSPDSWHFVAPMRMYVQGAATALWQLRGEGALLTYGEELAAVPLPMGGGARWAATLVAHVAQRLAADELTPAPSTPGVGRDLIARAMGYLEQAVDRGFGPAAALRADGDFAALYTEPAFDRLLARMPQAR